MVSFPSKSTLVITRLDLTLQVVFIITVGLATCNYYQFVCFCLNFMGTLMLVIKTVLFIIVCYITFGPFGKNYSIEANAFLIGIRVYFRRSRRDGIMLQRMLFSVNSSLVLWLKYRCYYNSCIRFFLVLHRHLMPQVNFEGKAILSFTIVQCYALINPQNMCTKMSCTSVPFFHWLSSQEVRPHFYSHLINVYCSQVSSVWMNRSKISFTLSQ